LPAAVVQWQNTFLIIKKVGGSGPAATASTGIEKNGKISELVKIFTALASG
jgi:hypothetical protein